MSCIYISLFCSLCLVDFFAILSSPLPYFSSMASEQQHQQQQKRFVLSLCSGFRVCFFSYVHVYYIVSSVCVFGILEKHRFGFFSRLLHLVHSFN